MSVTIKIIENGPYRIEGEFKLVDAQGNEVAIRKPSLCRCGCSLASPAW